MTRPILDNPLKIVDLFAGCGGLTLGFLNEGFSVVAAFEHWKAAAKVYEANFSHPLYETDLRDVAAAKDRILEFMPEMIIGGPPCQDFSHAGKRTEGKRADLTLKFATLIEEIRPTWFVMENVERLRDSLIYKKARDIFKTSGYGLTEVTLDASKCGVPQKRKRFFCIGKKKAQDRFLEDAILQRRAEKPMTPRGFLGEELGVDYYYRHPRSYHRRAIFSIDEPAPTIRGVNRPVGAGYAPHPGDAADVALSRPLTTLERARLQTFPQSFKFPGTKTNLEQMIGNAVPVNLAAFVAAAIKDHIATERRLSATMNDAQEILRSSNPSA